MRYPMQQAVGIRGLVWFVIVLFIVPPVLSMKAGVFVEFPNSLEQDCVDVNAGATAKQALEASRFRANYSYAGKFLDGINGLKSDFAHNRSWWFYYSDSGGLKLSNVGITQRSLGEHGYVYFGYYSYGKAFQPDGSPKEVGFYDACPSEANKLRLKEVLVQAANKSYTTNGTIIYGKLDEPMRLYVRLLNEPQDSNSEGSAHYVKGTVKFSIAGKDYNEDFILEPDESKAIIIPFKFPYNETGYYTARVFVNGADEFEGYTLSRKLLFGVKHPAVAVQEQPQISHNKSKPETPTGAALVPTMLPPKQRGYGRFVVIGLAIVLAVLLAVLLFLIKK